MDYARYTPAYLRWTAQLSIIREKIGSTKVEEIACTRIKQHKTKLEESVRVLDNGCISAIALPANAELLFYIKNVRARAL